MFYFRNGKGQRIRLPDDLNSQEFKNQYQAALAGKPIAAKRISASPSDRLQWLVDRYMESAKWAGFSNATRRQRGLIFKEAIKRSSNPRFAYITARHIQGGIDDRAATPAQANNFLKAMRGLFEWAWKNELVNSNPCTGAERIKFRSDGFPAWTVDDAVKFCQKWPVGTTARLAFELFLTSGLRRGDVHTAGRQHLRGDIFSMKTNKTGVEITVRFPQSLLDTIAATKTGDLHFIVKPNGQPFTSKESFGNWFSDRCRDADIAKSAHGIRKLSATISADSGASSHELMAHFGWKKVDQAETYTKGADRKKLGIQSSGRVSDQAVNIIPRTENSSSGKMAKTAVKSTS